MSACKITVLRRTFNPELAEKYCQYDTTACPRFADGETFIVQHGQQPPGDFCPWAWNDIYPAYLALIKAADFSPWMKQGNTMIRCCTDGIRPVIFMLERIEEA